MCQDLPGFLPSYLHTSTGNNQLLEAAKAWEWAYSQTLYVEMLTGNPMNPFVSLKVAFTIQDHNASFGIWPMLGMRMSYALHVWKRKWADESGAFTILHL